MRPQPEWEPSSKPLKWLSKSKKVPKLGGAVVAVAGEDAVVDKLGLVEGEGTQAQLQGIGASGLEGLTDSHGFLGSVHQRVVAESAVVLLGAVHEHLHHEVRTAALLDAADNLAGNARAVLDGGRAVGVIGGAVVAEAREEPCGQVVAGGVQVDAVEADGLQAGGAVDGVLDVHLNIGIGKQARLVSLPLLSHVLPQIHDAGSGRLHLDEARHVIAVHFGADSRKRAFLDGHAHIVVGHIHALVQPLEHDIAALDEHRAHAAGGDAAVIGHGLLLLVGHHGAGRRLDEAVLQRERTDLQLGKHSGVGEVLDAVGRKVPVLGIDLRVGRSGASPSATTPGTSHHRTPLPRRRPQPHEAAGRTRPEAQARARLHPGPPRLCRPKTRGGLPLLLFSSLPSCSCEPPFLSFGTFPFRFAAPPDAIGISALAGASRRFGEGSRGLSRRG